MEMKVRRLGVENLLNFPQCERKHNIINSNFKWKLHHKFTKEYRFHEPIKIWL